MYVFVFFVLDRLEVFKTPEKIFRGFENIAERHPEENEISLLRNLVTPPRMKSSGQCTENSMIMVRKTYEKPVLRCPSPSSTTSARSEEEESSSQEEDQEEFYKYLGILFS